jgi:hypothetical protein
LSISLHQEFAIQWIAWSWLFPICGAVAIATAPQVIIEDFTVDDADRKPDVVKVRRLT